MIEIDCRYNYILAVSGGADSMALLDIFIGNNVPHFEVVTVNHNLRSDSQSDCQLVLQYCQMHNVKCHIESIDVQQYSQQHKVSIETAARIMRYQVLQRYRCDYIVLAHNSDDNVESIVMNIARGSGTTGLEGIKRFNGKLYRPLLCYSKQQLVQYCIDNSVPFATDSTNADNNYTRNYVRNCLLPALETINSNAKQHILTLSGIIGSDNDYINSTIDYSAVNIDGNCATIDRQLLLSHRAVATRLIRYAIVSLRGNAVDIANSHYNDIIALADNNGGKKIVLPYDIVVYNDYDKVSFVIKEQPNTPIQPVAFAVGCHSTPSGQVVITDNKPDSVNALRFDINKIPSDAVIRNIAHGDTFTKFGGGTKSINRYLIDKKIPARDRSKLLVVASGNNILIIVGVEISKLVAVQQDSNIHYIYVEGE